jgi:hypothetical protein
VDTQQQEKWHQERAQINDLVKAQNSSAKLNQQDPEFLAQRRLRHLAILSLIYDLRRATGNQLQSYFDNVSSILEGDRSDEESDEGSNNEFLATRTAVDGVNPSRLELSALPGLPPNSSQVELHEVFHMELSELD